MKPYVVSLAPDPTVLSRREREVVTAIARGYANKEIADALKPPVSVKTIDTHRGHALKKLGLRNNSDLTRYAIRHGLIDVDGNEIGDGGTIDLRDAPAAPIAQAETA